MLDFSSITIRYGEFLAIDNVDVHVGAGEIVGIIGPNGAGKSSLLNAAAGVVKSSSGSVSFMGLSFDGVSEDERLARGLVLVPEMRGIFGMMSVYENLLMGAYLCRDKAEIRRRLEKVYSLFPILSERQRQLAGTMSGGQQQMVAIGSGLMAAPRLLMLDEPSIGLASVIIQNIGTTLTKLRADGISILLSEQNAKLAMAVADRVYVMQSGRVVVTRSTVSVLDDPSFVEAYLSLS